MVPQAPWVQHHGPGTHPGTHSPGTHCKEQQKMLKFNASVNGPSVEEQKSREEGLLSHGRKECAQPRGAPNGFWRHSSLHLTLPGRRGDLAGPLWCLADGTLFPSRCTQLHKNPLAASWWDRADSRKSMRLLAGAPKELKVGDGRLRMGPCSWEPELCCSPPPPPASLLVPSQNRGSVGTGRGAEWHVGTFCCFAWVGL